MQLLPLFLVGASLAVASQQHAVVTVTNYLPFEQHPCYEYFMLRGDGDVPAEACQPGACCIGVRDVNTNTDNGGNNVSGNNVGGNKVGDNNVGGNNIGTSTVGPDGRTTACPCSTSGSSKPTTAASHLSSDGNSKVITSGSVVAIISPSSGTPSSGSSKPVTSGSVITRVSSSGSVTITLVETITNNRTFTKDITATSVDIVPETSRETKVITTTLPTLVTFNTTSAGTPVVETITSEVLTTETITSDIVIFTTETLTTPVVVTSAEVITTNNSTITSLITTTSEETFTTILPSLTTATEITTTTLVPKLSIFTSTPASKPIIETTTSEVLTTETITTDVALSTTETLTTAVIVTLTEVTTTSNTTVTSLITTTSEKTIQIVLPSFTTTTEIITTPSVIVTPTLTTVTTHIVEPISSLIPPPPDPSTEREIPKSCPIPTCSHGIQYALYDNPFRGDLSPTYKTFSPAYFKKTKPVYNTTLQSAIYISDDNKGSGFNPLFKNAAAGYRGYLFACKAGRYRFNSPYSDDITIMWFGAKAYQDYTRANADIVQAYYGDNKPKNVYKDLAAGTYYPLRVLWGNTGGASDLSLRIYGPDGQDISGADQKGEHYLTTEACDGSYTPFPPWGQEK